MSASYRNQSIAASNQIQAPKEEYPWVLKNRYVYRMVEAYMNSFMSGNLMRTAETEGWGHELRAYAIASATIQAKLIASFRNIGINHVLYGYGWDYSLGLHDKRKNDLMAELRKQAATGAIGVEVPNEAIQFWKEYQPHLYKVGAIRGGSVAPKIKMPVTDKAYFESKKPKQEPTNEAQAV